METIVTNQEFEWRGILNSSYKSVVKSNFYKNKPSSLFGVKQQIKSAQQKLNSGIEIALKVCAFVILLITVYS
ncbi:hypothetical protein E1J38_004955 [Seonamhaeicola sediminis]|uniref:Uncharacterized protein n=1 Tax=Seonamhaeicola sediminis TaxID=2528206 RepID=A0A562YF26_9FLAO|nr:hypothetical protein [Seonamhaeicola sediminis]TWO33249.1 hypothetical protein E1J38_004955 [Seonamhaeicola sediminis]